MMEIRCHLLGGASVCKNINDHITNYFKFARLQLAKYYRDLSVTEDDNLGLTAVSLENTALRRRISDLKERLVSVLNEQRNI